MKQSHFLVNANVKAKWIGVNKFKVRQTALWNQENVQNDDRTHLGMPDSEWKWLLIFKNAFATTLEPKHLIFLKYITEGQKGQRNDNYEWVLSKSIQ